MIFYHKNRMFSSLAVVALLVGALIWAFVDWVSLLVAFQLIVFVTVFAIILLRKDPHPHNESNDTK
jgi:hypothetical protein